MKRAFLMFMAAMMVAGATGCSKVPAGNVGVKVYLLGTSKGVDHEVLPVGRYLIGINEELFLFPTFEQNPKYTFGEGENDFGDPIQFQTKEGLSVVAPMSVTYHIEPNSVAQVFQRYRLGVEEINRTPLRNMLRDATNEVASNLSVEDVYSNGKIKMVDDIQKIVAERAAQAGITVTQVSLLGSVVLPDNVKAALDQKVEATQRAQQRENELREAEAQAKKDVAKAEGEANQKKAIAEGNAAAILAEATAQAKANKLLAESLTPTLVEVKKLEKWDGKLPQFGGATAPAVPVITISK